MRKVCVVVGSRANYSSIKSVMRAVQAHPDLQLQLIVGASALLDRFGSVVDVIEARRLHAGRARHDDRRRRDAGDDGQVDRPRPARAADAVRAAQARRRRQRRRSLRDDGDGDRGRLHEHPARPHDGRRDQRHDRREHPPRGHQARAPAFSGEPGGGRAHHPAWARTRHACTSSAVRASISSRRSRSDGDGSSHAEWLEREGVGAHIDVDEPFLLVSQHPVTTEYGQGERADQRDADGAATSCRCRRSCCGRTSTPARRTSPRGMRKFRETHAARVHPLLQELPDRDLRAPDAAAARAWSATRARRFARARSSACRPSTSARARRAATAAPNVVDVGARPARDRRRRSGGSSRTAAIASDHLYGDGQRRRARIADVLAHARRLQRAEAARVHVTSDAASSASFRRAADRRGFRSKNLAPLGGRPLLAYTADAARASRRLTRVVVSTDDEEIARRRSGSASRCRSCGPARWPPTTRRCSPCCCTSSPRSSGASGYRPTSSCCCSRRRRCGAPSTSTRRSMLLESTGADSVVSVVAVPHQFSPSSVMRLEGERLRPCARRATLRVDAAPGQAAAVRAQRSGCARGSHAGGDATTIAVRAGHARPRRWRARSRSTSTTRSTSRSRSC